MMNLAARVSEEINRPLGYAVVTVDGLPRTLTSIEFALSRHGYAANYLGTAGWQGAECWLPPEEAWYSGDSLKFVIGPELVYQLESMPYELALRGEGMGETVRLTFIWPVELEPEEAGSQERQFIGGARILSGPTRRTPEPPPAPEAPPAIDQPPQARPEQPPPVLQPASPAPSSPTGEEPTAAPDQLSPAPGAALEPAPSGLAAEGPAPARGRWTVILTLALLALLAGGAGWWLWNRWHGQAASVTMTPPPSSPAPSPASEVRLPPPAPAPTRQPMPATAPETRPDVTPPPPAGPVPVQTVTPVTEPEPPAPPSATTAAPGTAREPAPDLRPSAGTTGAPGKHNLESDLESQFNTDVESQLESMLKRKPSKAEDKP